MFLCVNCCNNVRSIQSGDSVPINVLQLTWWCQWSLNAATLWWCCDSHVYLVAGTSSVFWCFAYVLSVARRGSVFRGPFFSSCRSSWPCVPWLLPQKLVLVVLPVALCSEGALSVRDSGSSSPSCWLLRSAEKIDAVLVNSCCEARSCSWTLAQYCFVEHYKTYVRYIFIPCSSPTKHIFTSHDCYTHDWWLVVCSRLWLWHRGMLCEWLSASAIRITT